MSGTKKRLSAWLPPTPCTPEMRENLVAVAKREGRSLADLQRTAISLFLSSSDNSANMIDGFIAKKERAS